MKKNYEVLVIIRFSPRSHTRTLAEILQIWQNLEFYFIHCKAVKVVQNDQIRMETWFRSVFLMNGTESRSFSHYQILT